MFGNDMDARTSNHMMSDLLQKVIDDQWSGQSRQGCHCHPNYVSACPDCKVTEYDQDDYHIRRTLKDHEEDCGRMLLIKEAQAYLRVENELAEKRGEDEIYIPEL